MQNSYDNNAEHKEEVKAEKKVKERYYIDDVKGILSQLENRCQYNGALGDIWLNEVSTPIFKCIKNFDLGIKQKLEAICKSEKNRKRVIKGKSGIAELFTDDSY